ncbi:hypothetical protein HaLaN_13380, partial [Haematococcus lacustris]
MLAWVAAASVQRGEAFPSQGLDELNKLQHQVLRPGRVSRAEHPPLCSRPRPT